MQTPCSKITKNLGWQWQSTEPIWQPSEHEALFHGTPTKPPLIQGLVAMLVAHVPNAKIDGQSTKILFDLYNKKCDKNS